MVRPAATGLATAFFRLYLLDALAVGPARPAALLAAIAAERLPFASGAFGRALQSLLEGGYVTPAQSANVALTPLGAAERVAERERWSAVVPTLLRLLGDSSPRAAPVIAEAAAPVYRAVPVAEAYLDRVLVAHVRERIAAARDGGPGCAVALGQLSVDGVAEATRRAMVHRAIRAPEGRFFFLPAFHGSQTLAENQSTFGPGGSLPSDYSVSPQLSYFAPAGGFTLGGSATLLGGDVRAYRYGDSGVAIVVPVGADRARGERVALLLRTRLDELLRTMTATVRAFGQARWAVHVGSATWSEEIATSAVLLRGAQDALERDAPELTAA